MLEFHQPAIQSLLVGIDETAQATGQLAADPEVLLNGLIETFQRKEIERQRPAQIGTLREGGLDDAQQAALLDDILRQKRNLPNDAAMFIAREWCTNRLTGELVRRLWLKTATFLADKLRRLNDVAPEPAGISKPTDGRGCLGPEIPLHPVRDGWRGRSDTVDLFDKDFQELIARGKSQGYLTYDEVNSYLPDEEVNPDKLDNLLIALEEEGIDLVNEPPEPEFYDAMEPLDTEEQNAERLAKGEVPCGPVEPPPLPSEMTKFSSDPIRMYLSQMAEIPLLARGEEIALAKKMRSRGSDSGEPSSAVRWRCGRPSARWSRSTRVRCPSTARSRSR